MPVGTYGAVKGTTPEQLRANGCEIILGNTYHLGNRPGGETLAALGGIHGLSGWDRNVLTDSGGFQMVSLLKLAEVTEEGVTFESPHDGSRMCLTPERSMEIQNQIGADIMMALDDVVSSLTEGPRVEEAMHRTIRWIDRCVKAHARPSEQALYGIVQGGLDARLRKQCLDALVERDLPGYAIGGLSGGENKEAFWRMVALCTDPLGGLPREKPRYVMGVGYAQDLVVCTALGADQFDCVYPTRTARFGSALVPEGTLRLTQACFAQDHAPLDADCDCSTCRLYSRSFLHCVARKPLGAQLLSHHNIAYQMRLMRAMRQAIIDQTFPSFVRDFFRRQCPDGNFPEWTVNALTCAGISLA